MKSWWQNLTQREQSIVAGGAILMILTLFYLFIWSPLNSNIKIQKTYLTYQQSLYRWMQQANVKLQKFKASGNKVVKIAPQAMLSTVDQSLKKHQLNLFAKTLEQSADNSVLIKFNQVPFDAMLKWLDDLWQQHAIKVSEINIKPNQNKNGLVEAQVLLKPSL